MTAPARDGTPQPPHPATGSPSSASAPPSPPAPTGGTDATPMVRSPDGASQADRPPVVGLIGAIGAGKSTVAAAFASLGWTVIDADRIGHEVLRRPDVIDAVRRAWGDAVIGADGQVDRKAVAARVFRADGDRGELDRLNAITHPPLWGELRDRLRRALATTAPSLAVRAPDTLHLPAPGGASAVPTVCGEAGPGGTAPPARFPETVRSRGVRPGVVIDAALLLEAGLDRLCDVVVFVDAPEPLRQARVAAGRGWSADELRRRESTQLPLREKVERAAHVVDNSGSAEATAALVAGLHGRILGTPFPAVGCTTRPGT